MSGNQELEEVDLPILIEPSSLYCKANGKKCKHRNLSYGDYCGLNSMSIRTDSVNKWKAPDWCPLKWEALFPKK